METALSLQIAEDFDSIRHLASEWDEAVARLGGPIYMTFGWLRVWWEFYGAGRPLRLHIFRQDGAMVALLPLYIDPVPMFPVRARIARLVGANLPPKSFDPPVDPNGAREVFGTLFHRLFTHDRCDLLSLGPVSDSWAARAPFQAACERAIQAGSSVHTEHRDVRTLFRLPGTFEEYLAALEPGERKGRMKRMRQLERAAVIVDDVVADPTVLPEEFDHFAALHTRQWQALGKGGHFLAWPNALAYNRAQVACHARHGRVRFFRLLADGETIASRYTFSFAGVLFSELPARATGQPWDKLGVGVSSLIRFKGQAIAAGFTLVDSGLGAYDHKAGVGGEEIPVSITRISGPSPVHRARAAAALFMARAIRVGCQKIWYRRIVPRLPGTRGRTQSVSWLRFDY